MQDKSGSRSGVLQWVVVLVVGVLVVTVVLGLSLIPRLNDGQKVLDAARPAFATESLTGARAGIDIISTNVDMADPLMTSDGTAAAEVPKLIAFASEKTGLSQVAVLAALQTNFPHTTALIDTGMTQNQAKASGMTVKAFSASAADDVVAALGRASLIVVTHEHVDHIGGLVGTTQLSKILPAAQLTTEQVSNMAAMAPANIPANLLSHYTPLQYDRYHALAPGVVLIKSPGHTPGSQMVYVRATTGQEYLFIGDVAWHRRNITLARERARLVTWLFLGEDRDAVLAELTELHRLTVDEPQLHIVPGHDADVITAMERQQLLTRGFQ